MNPVTLTVTNPIPITLHPVGPASVYPSAINVGGTGGVVTDVNVTLTGLSHTNPDDLDVMLVGPTGQAVLLTSDAGGTADVVSLTLAFDDQAAITLPDAAPLASGTSKPTNYDSADSFPAPAPSAPTTLTPALSVFNGLPADGTWTLYVLDDTPGEGGSLASGWTLTLEFTPAGPPTPNGPANFFWAPEQNPNYNPANPDLSANTAGNWRQGPSITAPVHTAAPDGDDSLYYVGGLSNANSYIASNSGSNPTPRAFAAFSEQGGYSGTVDFRCSAFVGVMSLNGAPSSGIAQNDAADYTANGTGGQISIVTSFTWNAGSINDGPLAPKLAYFNMLAGATGSATPTAENATAPGVLKLGSDFTLMGDQDASQGAQFKLNEGVYQINIQSQFTVLAAQLAIAAPVPKPEKPLPPPDQKVRLWASGEEKDVTKLWKAALVEVGYKGLLTINTDGKRAANNTTPATAELKGETPRIINNGDIIIGELTQLHVLPDDTTAGLGGVFLKAADGAAPGLIVGDPKLWIEAGSGIYCDGLAYVQLGLASDLMLTERKGANGAALPVQQPITISVPKAANGLWLKQNSGIQHQSGASKPLKLEVKGEMRCEKFTTIELYASKNTDFNDKIEATGRITFAGTPPADQITILSVRWFDPNASGTWDDWRVLIESKKEVGEGEAAAINQQPTYSHPHPASIPNQLLTLDADSKKIFMGIPS